VGQPIVIESTEIVDRSIIVMMNRSLTSQEGEGYDSLAAADAADSFGARLAARLFEADESLERVYVASNAVVVTRPGDLSDDIVSSLSSVIEDLLLFYPDA
jgi:hypothetical protein